MIHGRCLEPGASDSRRFDDSDTGFAVRTLCRLVAFSILTRVPHFGAVIFNGFHGQFDQTANDQTTATASTEYEA